MPTCTALSVSIPRTCGLSNSIAHANSNFYQISRVFEDSTFPLYLLPGKRMPLLSLTKRIIVLNDCKS
ncbi:hypothetical protein ACFP3I_11295 [Chryseobacterium arachidis]|uniref:hypothetical protein n=1 Tax=Chryseobacterium arachidis TaxID=1416778 RepID=UPI003620A8D3